MRKGYMRARPKNKLHTGFSILGILGGGAVLASLSLACYLGFIAAVVYVIAWVLQSMGIL